MSEDNRALVLGYVDAMWRRQDLEAGLEFLDPTMRADARLHATQLFDAFSDLGLEILEPGVIADDTHVVMRIAVSGVHDRAAFAGVEPSGRRLTWESIRIFRTDNGRITATWAMQDRLGLMEQLGAIEMTSEPVHWAGDVDPESD